MKLLSLLIGILFFPIIQKLLIDNSTIFSIKNKFISVTELNSNSILKRNLESNSYDNNINTFHSLDEPIESVEKPIFNLQADDQPKMDDTTDDESTNTTTTHHTSGTHSVLIFNSFSSLNIIYGSISIIIIIAGVLSVEYIFESLNQLTNDTPFQELVSAIEKELMIVGTMAFIFKIIINVNLLANHEWILALEYAGNYLITNIHSHISLNTIQYTRLMIFTLKIYI